MNLISDTISADYHLDRQIQYNNPLIIRDFVHFATRPGFLSERFYITMLNECPNKESIPQVYWEKLESELIKFQYPFLFEESHQNVTVRYSDDGVGVVIYFANQKLKSIEIKSRAGTEIKWTV